MKIEANGISIAYDLVGEKEDPVVVLHHSLATNRGMWADLAADLVEEGFQVLTFDARGHGETEAPDEPYNFKMLTKDVTGLMDALDIAFAHHVGLSMGGFVCQYLGIYAPQYAISIALASTASELPKGAQKVWDERIEAVKKDGMETQVESTIERWFTPDYLEEEDEIVDYVRDMIRQTSPEGFCGWGEAIKKLKLTPKLSEIECPVQIIVGEEDKGTPVSAANLMFEKILDASLEVFPDASHQLPLEYPEEFMESVTDFLAEIYEDEDEFPEI